MEITFLGTASAYPTPSRGVSCIAIRNDDWVWLFDCGEGSQIQIMRSSIKPGKICKIFISHLHGDHLFGLPGLMCTISQNNQRDEPVEIYGPEGLAKYLRISLELSQSQLGFKYVVHELKIIPEQRLFLTGGDLTKMDVDLASDDRLHPNEEHGSLIECDSNSIWNLYEDSKIGVKAVWLRHRIPSFGFVIHEKPIPGKLDPEKLKAKGIPPGPLYARIKLGETITSPTGEKISAENVVGPPRPGRKIIVCGDTSYSDELLKIGQNADILIHEATLQNSSKETALQNGHSTPDMAADIALRLDVEKLVLTHYSQRYKPIDSTDISNKEESVQLLLDEASAVIGNERVVAAYDFLVLTIPLKS